MRFSINRAELAEALAVASSVAATRTPKDILKCVLVEVQGDLATFAATDLELGVRFHATQVQVDGTGKVVVPVDKLNQIVRESGDDILAIEVVDDICHVRGQDSHFQIFTNDPKEFPPVAQMDGAPDFEIPFDRLKRISEWTVFAAARENTRYAINGVLWELEGKSLTLVSTDGRRLSKAVHELETDVGAHRSGIVPIKAMHVFSRVLSDGEATFAVRLTSNQIVLRSARVTVTSSLLEGHFPKYEDVIPTDCDQSVEFDTQELLSAVRRAALLTNEESKGIRLTFKRGELTLSSRAPEQGEAVIVMPVQYKGSEMEIGFNPVFLVDVLRAVGEEKITFDFGASNRPGMVHCGEQFVYVVMPVNL